MKQALLPALTIVAAVALMLVKPGAAHAQSDPSQDASMRPLEVLVDHFVRSVLPTAMPDIAQVRTIAAQYEQTMNGDGRWPDLDYQDQNRSTWMGGTHLGRVLTMAKAARLKQDAGQPDPHLTARTLAALKAWTDTDAQNPNWWWNQIGIPELTGEIACLMRDHLPPAELAAAIKVLKRSRMEGATGANLTWAALNQVILGALEKSPPTAQAAFDRLYEEVRLADAASQHEGIQPDFSFHQHGPQLYSGGYGLFYANDVGRLLYISWGTPFHISDARRRLFDRYMLDGLRWITWADMLDYSSISRIITRPGITAAPREWSRGPISPAGAAYSLGNVTRLLATLPGRRQQEYARWAARLAQDPTAEPLTGNKHFWCSDYMVHRRKTFMTSVKMFSERTLNAEIVNGEGRLSHHLSDGANFLYLTGHEYQDIFPCWDWQKIPGTTAEQAANMNTIGPRPVGTRGEGWFVGGVSDGTYGLCAMDLRRGALQARKAWFFFDNAYVCLGTGITITNGHPVITSVNQARLAGPVFDNESAGPLPAGRHVADSLKWVYHNRTGYLFPKGEAVVLSNTNQSGRWSDCGTGGDGLVTEPVFNLWIDHGAGCRDASYEYLVLPDVTLEQMREFAGQFRLSILSNRKNVQAVYSPSNKLVAVAFWSAGGIETPLGPIKVNQPCLLLAQHLKNNRIQITVANPQKTPLTVEVQMAGKSTYLDLPVGQDAGSSASQELHD